MFKDKYGLYNMRPVGADGNPSGNDGPILTSYAQKLGLPVDVEFIRKHYWERLSGGEIPVERLPGKTEPPVSRDTILGWYWLGFLSLEVLMRKGWNFSPYPVPAFSLFGTLGALWRMRGSHRNSLWKNGGEPHLWRFAFSVPWQDRAYMMRDSGMKVPWRYALVEKVSLWLPKSYSSKKIMWRKYK